MQEITHKLLEEVEEERISSITVTVEKISIILYDTTPLFYIMALGNLVSKYGLTLEACDSLDNWEVAL